MGPARSRMDEDVVKEVTRKWDSYGLPATASRSGSDEGYREICHRDWRSRRFELLYHEFVSIGVYVNTVNMRNT